MVLPAHYAGIILRMWSFRGKLQLNLKLSKLSSGGAIKREAVAGVEWILLWIVLIFKSTVGVLMYSFFSVYWHKMPQ